MQTCRKNKIDLGKLLSTLHLPGPNDHPLKSVLMRNGVRQRAVSEALGLSQGLVSKILNGKIKASPDVEFNLNCLETFIQRYGGIFSDMEMH